MIDLTLKFLFFNFIIFFNVLTADAQASQISGYVIDGNNKPLEYSTVTLMHPEDSTLAYFGITNANGFFVIRNIQEGHYILQCVLLGYESYYRKIDIPAKEPELGAIVLKERIINLDEAQVNAERIPLQIKKDTIEYDAAAFKTRPDAAVEDLLKKLPGVEVDKSGNIKAQGEDVQNVLVDGREFFGNDPKVASKNLPADAIDKVQVYDKKSDEAELTGINDGIRSRTINLLLKEDKKSAWIGELEAGGGTDEHYRSLAKAFRFTQKNQFAALGMLNNINQFGFSFQDYIDFNGGFRQMMNGEDGFKLHLGDDGNFPVDFGQRVTGDIRSGAAGVNYSYEKTRNNRISLSYLANGNDKQDYTKSNIYNFSNANTFVQDEVSDDHSKTFNQRISLSARKEISSGQNLIFNSNAILNGGTSEGSMMSLSNSDDRIVNQLNNRQFSDAGSNEIFSSLTYLSKYSGNWKLLKINAALNAKGGDKKFNWSNNFNFFNPDSSGSDNAFRRENSDMVNYSLNTSLTRSIGKSTYMVPGIKAGINTSGLNKKQLSPDESGEVQDSLSGDYTSKYSWTKPSLTFKYSTESIQLSVSAQLEYGIRRSEFNEITRRAEEVLKLLPQISIEKEFKRGKRLSFAYEAVSRQPESEQMFPLLNSLNSLRKIRGNPGLKSETEHSLQLHGMYFDQFSFTSLFAGLNFSYTKDKINWSRIIDAQLNQDLTLVNVPDDYDAVGTLEFSTPVRRLGINISVDYEERYNQGINYVNGTENVNRNNRHTISLRLDKRRKEKLEAGIGGEISLSQASYSIMHSLDYKYASYNLFIDLACNPSEKWSFELKADYTWYESASFKNNYEIPLIKAAVHRYFFTKNRLVLTLETNDVLDKNKGIERVSELNYLEERNSRVLGRYFMFGLKYKLNKFSKGRDKIKVDIK